MATLSESNLVSLLKRLSSLVKSFSKDINEIAEKGERNAPTAEITDVINHIKAKAPVAEREKQEYEEIAKLLNQLLVDKKVLSYIKVETADWLKLLEAIESRMESHRDSLTGDERQLYNEIDSLTKKLRETIRKE